MAAVAASRGSDKLNDAQAPDTQTSSLRFPAPSMVVKSRHSPSLSSPPSLGVAFGSMAATTNNAMLYPTSTTFASSGSGLVSMRKSSMTGHVPLTSEAISYPTIVARSDVVSTFTPSGPAPAPQAQSGKDQDDDLADAVILTVKRGSKARPAPLKIAGSTHTFLSPLLEKTGISTKFGFGGKEGAERPPGTRSLRKSSKVEAIYADPRANLVENQAAVAEYYPDETRSTEAMLARAIESQEAQAQDDARKDSGYGSNSAGQMASSSPSVPLHAIRHRPVERAPLPVTNEWPQTPMTAVPSSVLTPPPPPSAPRRILSPRHRRATSADQSPKLMQQAAFEARGESSLDDRPHTQYTPSTIGVATRRTRPKGSQDSTASGQRFFLDPSRSPPGAAGEHSSLAALRGVRRSSSTASSSAGSAVTAARKDSRGSRLDDVFVSTHRGSPPPSSGASTSRRPSMTHHHPQLPSNDHVNISVKSGSSSSVSREIARPALTSDGVTLVLTSHHPPEDLEVGWTCSSGIAENGLPYSTYSLTLRLKGAPPSFHVAAPTPELQHRNDAATTKASLFSYRMGSEPNSSPSVTAAEEPGSPKSSPAPAESSPPDPPVLVAHRIGGSISSESSNGPLTPHYGGPWLVTPADAVLQRRGSAHQTQQQHQQQQYPAPAHSPTKARFDKYLQHQRQLTPSGALGLGFLLGPTGSGSTYAPPPFEADPKTPTRARPGPSLLPEPAGIRSRQDSIFVAGILGVDEDDVDQSLKMLSEIPTPNPQEVSNSSASSAASSTSDEEEGTMGSSSKERRMERKLRKGRQRSRMMSKWSDTDADEDGNEEGEIDPMTPDPAGSGEGVQNGRFLRVQ